MAALSFYTNGIQIQTGSGLAFFGNGGFGTSVDVAAWQGRTYISNSAGTLVGAEGNNVKYLSIGSGILGQLSTGLDLQKIPNYQTTVNSRFTHNSAVQIQNCKLIAYDGTNINNNPSGVTVAAFESIHPSDSQAITGSGDTTWQFIAGSSSVLSLCPSPGNSGDYAGNGSNSTRPDVQHDHYWSVSMSPNSVGSKTGRFYVSVEYF